MTRTQMRTIIRKRLGETTAAYWPETQLNDWINFSGRDVCYKTKCRRTSDTMDSTEDVSSYNLKTEFTDFITLIAIYFKRDGSKFEKLDPVSREDMDTLHPGWKDADSGTPYEYFYDEEEDVLELYVPPNAANAGSDYVEVYYGKQFTDISSDSGSPSGVSHQLQLAMIDYVVATGKETRGLIEDANDAWSKYSTRIKEYLAIKNQERHEDVDLITKNYRNV